MKPRYRKYFMRNILSIRDEFATYYVQEQFARRNTMFGVELMKFFSHHQTVKWIHGCMDFDRCTRYALRSFLSESGPQRYLLHRMDDRQVINEVARVLMDGEYPVVIRPEFEPPWRQSELIDMLYEVRYGVTGAEPVSGSTSKRFQFKNLMANKWPEITLDGSALDNIINMPEAVFNTLVNQYVVDVSNALLWDAQYVQDHGFKKWLADGLKNQWAVLKTDTKKLEELARTGPNELLWYLTSYELWDDVGTQLKNVYNAESWKNAFVILIPAFLLHKLGGGKGAGASTTEEIEIAETRQSQAFAERRKTKAKLANEPEPIEIKTVKKDAFELEPENGPKTTSDPEEIIRRDNNPHDSVGRSGKKSHIDKNGDLVPANQKGKATVEQHIRGAEPAKSDSPYTSFSADPNTPKSYGNKKITVDSKRLKKDIDSGKLKDVEIVDQDKIGGKLQKKIDQAQAKYDANPSKKNSKLLERRKMDLKNTQRDKEILIKGKVPKKYIKVTTD